MRWRLKCPAVIAENYPNAGTPAQSALGRGDRSVQIQIPLRVGRGLAQELFQALQHGSLFRGSCALRPSLAAVRPVTDFFCD
jgi:hypothetical protein